METGSINRRTHAHAGMTWCGPPSLLERSYALPPHFPYPPMRLVMEQKPGSCDFYHQSAFCSDVAADRAFEPEYHVREVIASFLTGCHSRTCHAIDLGANNGWFSLMMLALGAHVTAAEPQADFAAALRDTAELNCAASRMNVISAYVSARNGNGTRPVTWGWRGGGFPAGLQLPDAPVVPLISLLPPPPAEVTLLKLDGDGEDGRWLSRVEQLLRDDRVRIRTIIVECNQCKGHVVHSLQRQHNYTVYQLDMAIDKRWIDARGHDVYANFGPTQLPRFVEELYSIRLMRHLYRWRDNLTPEEARAGVAFHTAYNPSQLLLTREPLIETRREHPRAIRPKGVLGLGRRTAYR